MRSATVRVAVQRGAPAIDALAIATGFRVAECRRSARRWFARLAAGDGQPRRRARTAYSSADAAKSAPLSASQRPR